MLSSNHKASRNVHKKIDVHDQNDVFMASIKNEHDQDDPNFVKRSKIIQLWLKMLEEKTAKNSQK